MVATGSNQRYYAWTTAQKKRTRELAPDPKSLTTKALRQYVYRPLDFRWLYDDSGWIDWYRPDLQAINAGGKKVPSIVTIPSDHGAGPAVMHVDRLLMDQHVFNNRGEGGVQVVAPAPARPDAARPQVPRPGLVSLRLRLAGARLAGLPWCGPGRRRRVQLRSGGSVSAGLHRDSLAGVGERLPTVPLTGDPAVFRRAATLGARLRDAWSLSVARDPAVGWRNQPSTTKRLGKVRTRGIGWCSRTDAS